MNHLKNAIIESCNKWTMYSVNEFNKPYLKTTPIRKIGPMVKNIGAYLKVGVQIAKLIFHFSFFSPGRNWVLTVGKLKISCCEPPILNDHVRVQPYFLKSRMILNSFHKFWVLFRNWKSICIGILENALENWPVRTKIWQFLKCFGVLVVIISLLYLLCIISVI